ncbi:hypothetical protein OC835_007851 [Tilletia horrida]|nr:hypothetical protein OC835_007851 [Tilletia horrida]
MYLAYRQRRTSSETIYFVPEHLAKAIRLLVPRLPAGKRVKPVKKRESVFADVSERSWSAAIPLAGLEAGLRFKLGAVDLRAALRLELGTADIRTSLPFQLDAVDLRTALRTLVVSLMSAAHISSLGHTPARADSDNIKEIMHKQSQHSQVQVTSTYGKNADAELAVRRRAEEAYHAWQSILDPTQAQSSPSPDQQEDGQNGPALPAVAPLSVQQLEKRRMQFDCVEIPTRTTRTRSEELAEPAAKRRRG